MFFETTYVPSPQLSAVSADDDVPASPSLLSSSPTLAPAETAEMLTDTPIDHIIFVIHGIGQQTEQYGHFYDHIKSLQELTRQVLQTKVPDHNVRIELIPIEWHRHIHDQVDPIMDRITLKSIPTIRMIENEYLADVLYYFSRDHGQAIVDNVTRLFNTSYQNVIQKHPDFNGKIVILGYSLGGVITWDILSHQRPHDSPEEEADYAKMNVKFGKLDFVPDFFFGLGAPIAAVLTFRNQSPITYHPDMDAILFQNIFHAFDPLAYRIEPLYDEYYTDQSAVLIERALPLGPSFSFPSMPSLPSLPGMNFFSFWSWGMANQEPSEEDLAAAEEAILEQPATTDTNELLGEGVEETDKSGNKNIMSSVNAFLRYFSKGRGSISHLKEPKDQGQNNKIGIITWDPLREGSREDLLLERARDDALCIHVDQASFDTNEPVQKDKRRPFSIPISESLPMPIDPYGRRSLSRSQTVGSEHPSLNVQSESTKQHLGERHHLVEVLGIDGVRVDSLERARVNFDRRSHHHHHPIPSPVPTPSVSAPFPTSSTSTSSFHKTPTTRSVEADENISNLSDGMATEIANEATQPGRKSSSTDEQTNADLSDETRADEAQHALGNLPGGRRVDHVLQPENVMSLIANEYLVGLRAHFSYWTNKDFLWHVIRRLEGDEHDEEGPDPSDFCPVTTASSNGSDVSP